MIEQVATERLIPAQYNPRTMPAHEQDALKRSLQRWGFVEPIVANRAEGREGIVIGGHQRLRAAIELGMTEVPVFWVELDEARERKLNVTLNNLSGQWDSQQLADLLERIESGEVLDMTGMQRQEIEAVLSRQADAVREAAVTGPLHRCPRCRTEW